MLTNFFLRFAAPWFGIGILISLILIIAARRFMHKAVIYRFSLGSFLKKKSKNSFTHKTIFYCLRLLTLLLLTMLIAKIQIVDYRSKVPVSGIDIVLVLDVSGSMELKDDNDHRSRFDIAKAEAIRFIEKRTSDALGLVLFGKDTVSRCPITFDKQLLQKIVEDLEIGIIDSEFTMLITGIVTAANRLKHSKAQSKVMIVLTDGEPSDGDLDPSIGIEIAKKLGIKIYTIGIGSEREELFMHPFYGRMLKPKVNKELLTKIAHETGGYYFFARNASDMRSIYDKIDMLEKTDHEVPLFSLYYDLLVPVVLIIMGLLILELLFSTFVWFII